MMEVRLQLKNQTRYIGCFIYEKVGNPIFISLTAVLSLNHNAWYFYDYIVGIGLCRYDSDLWSMCT